jgi:hypothetical protein
MEPEKKSARRPQTIVRTRGLLVIYVRPDNRTGSLDDHLMARLLAANDVISELTNHQNFDMQSGNVERFCRALPQQTVIFDAKEVEGRNHRLGEVYHHSGIQREHNGIKIDSAGGRALACVGANGISASVPLLAGFACWRWVAPGKIDAP